MYRILILLFFLIAFFENTRSQEVSSRKEPLAISKANFYLNRLQQEYKNGNYQDHKAYSDSLYHLAKQNNLTKFQILGMVNQAVFHNNKSEQKQSIKLYRDALTLCELIPEDSRTKAIVLVNLGNTYYRIEAFKKAIDTMKEVLTVIPELEDNEKIQAAAYLGISNNYRKLKDYDEALLYLSKARSLAKEMNNEGVLATVLSNLSDTYYNQKNYTQAKTIGEQALQLPPMARQAKKRAWLLLILGVSENKLNNPAKALEYLKEAEEIAVASNLIEIEMHTSKHLAEIFSSKKDTDTAQRYHEKHLVLQNQILANQKEATKLDLEEDLEAKDAIISSNKTMVVSLLDDKATLRFWAVLIGVSLSVFLFFTVRKKKQQDSEAKILRQQLAKLKEVSFSLPTKETLNNVEEKKSIPYKNSALKPEDHAGLKQQLLSVMIEKKPYLNSELSQSDLASELKITTHHLSEILNTGFNQNFYNFINSYRIIHAQKLIKDDEHKFTKMIAIAFDSGFKNKASFNRVFKKHTGLTPSDYKKSV